MGYLKDQSGIMKRFINEDGNWKSHVDQCKNFIIQCAENKNKKNCAVLGSGWLLDVPLNYLSQSFENVYLVDIYHPKPVLSKIRKYHNVICITEDLTGGWVNKIYDERRQIKHTGVQWLNNIKFTPDFFYSGYDFVISLNLLSQLDVLLIDYLKKITIIKDSELEKIRKEIQNTHLNSLPVRKTCLISDFEELKIDDNDHTINVKNLVYADKDRFNPMQNWKWKFDTLKTYQNSYNTYFNVIAMEI